MNPARQLKGQKIGRYTLVEHLASGGMAEIFLARYESVGGFSKDLALKVLQARYADNREIIEMFLAEARLAAMLSHPNIVHVFDVGEDAGVHFIAMEHLPGKTLTDVIRRGIEASRPLSMEHAIHIVAQTAAAMAYMHDGLDARGERFGIIHRDISPTNLVIGFSGQTKVIDFGIARQGSGGDESGRPGKASYMSPEQVKGDALDGRSDVFSLGTILYEITLGRRLWRGPMEVVMKRIVEEKAAPPTYVRRDYPRELELIVLKTLEKNPDDRYASAGELFSDLERFLEGMGAHVRNHHLARYLQDLFSVDAPVSEVGLRRAQAFIDDEVDDPEALDFDRPSSGAGKALADALRASGPIVPLAHTAEGPAAAPEVAAEPAPSEPPVSQPPKVAPAATARRGGAANRPVPEPSRLPMVLGIVGAVIVAALVLVLALTRG